MSKSDALIKNLKTSALDWSLLLRALTFMAAFKWREEMSGQEEIKCPWITGFYSQYLFHTSLWTVSLSIILLWAGLRIFGGAGCCIISNKILAFLVSEYGVELSVGFTVKSEVQLKSEDHSVSFATEGQWCEDCWCEGGLQFGNLHGTSNQSLLTLANATVVCSK